MNSPPPTTGGGDVWDKVDAGISKAGRMARGKRFMGKEPYKGLGQTSVKVPNSRNGQTIKNPWHNVDQDGKMTRQS